MDIQFLRLFVDVVRHGHFSVVARNRGVTPSNISRTIKALEIELGFRLFQRTTRKVSLTEAGKVYFEKITPLLQNLEEAAHTATDLLSKPQGLLRVTCSTALGQICILPILPKILEKYPKLSVELFLTDEHVDLLKERIDIAIRLGVLKDSSLIAQQLMPTHYYVCASPSYLAEKGNPRAPEDLASHDCLLFTYEGFRSEWIFCNRNKKTVTVQVKGRIFTSGALALRSLVLRVLGPALLPHWLIDKDIANRKMINLFPHYRVSGKNIETAAWFVYPSSASLSLKAKIFIQALKSHIKQTGLLKSNG